MKIYNQTAITNNNYQNNTARKQSATPNFKAQVYTKLIGEINIPDGLKTKDAVEQFLKNRFSGIFEVEKINQILAEVLTALGVANTVIENKNDNTITEEEKQKLDDYLKKYGFDPQDINKLIQTYSSCWKVTPLMLVCDRICHFPKDQNTYNILKILLKRPDINVNTQDDNGNTALMYLSHTDNTDAIKLLLEHDDINIYIKNHSGSTAMDYGHPEIAEMKQEIDARKAQEASKA